MILVTGSAGKTGRSVLQALSEKGLAVRALVHRPEQVHIVEMLGAQQVIVGDMKSMETVQEAMQGVRAVYHICPNMSPQEVPIGRTVIAAAQSANVQHFVYHSVLKPQVEAMPHHWNKMLVEEILIGSGLAYTILQPAAYMQNILANWESILSKSLHPVPYPAGTRLSLVDLVDVAQVAALVLSEAGHEFAIYELAGTRGMTQTEVAALLGQELGKPVKVVAITLDEWRKDANAKGLGDYQVETLVKMFSYYRDHGFEGNTQVLSWLLGRSPTSLRDFARRSIKERQLRQHLPVS